MNRLKEISKKEFLWELRERVEKKKISEEEIFIALKSQKKPEMITEYKKVNLAKLTPEDWKKACEILKRDKNYQEEAKLWESIDDE